MLHVLFANSGRGFENDIHYTCFLEALFSVEPLSNHFIAAFLL